MWMRSRLSLRRFSTAIRRRIEDEGDWCYSSEWWGNEFDGHTVLRSTSDKGNGVVSVVAYPSSRPVQGKDRLLLKCVAEQLELEGSYVPRTYIEQIQLEKLVDEVMTLPDDLKTKLSTYDDLVVASPKEALSRAAERVAMRNKNLRRYQAYNYEMTFCQC